MRNTQPKSSKKRHHEGDSHGGKKTKFEENGVVSSKEQSTKEKSAKEQLSPNQIKDMMANAQKMIEERKKALSALRSSDTRHKGLEPPSVSVQRTEEKAKKIAQLQAQIQSKLSTGVLKIPGLNRPEVINKPTPLILDSQGRTVDVTGKEIQLTHVIPTLKANIRAKKREEFRQQLQEKTVEDISESSFFDPRISAKPSIRNKRALRFHEPGKFQQLADRMRMKKAILKAALGKNRHYASEALFTEMDVLDIRQVVNWRVEYRLSQKRESHPVPVTASRVLHSRGLDVILLY
ncbi:U4/U6 small nuclear ribonucleoprotein Prp3 [Homalodisca vitripennis]|nr:U4/U6 small nuclear ribonucleoprotein Prp3 [Homalodisca vitripennis]